VLRRIFRPKSDDKIGNRRKLRNEEIHNLNPPPSIIIHEVKEDEMGRACSTHGEEVECIYHLDIKARTKETIRKTWT
jgi:hypothetical protein